MKTIRNLTLAALAATLLFPTQAAQPAGASVTGSMRGNAGTAFNLTPVFDSEGNPVFPWRHEVRVHADRDGDWQEQDEMSRKDPTA